MTVTTVKRCRQCNSLLGAHWTAGLGQMCLGCERWFCRTCFHLHLLGCVPYYRKNQKSKTQGETR